MASFPCLRRSVGGSWGSPPSSVGPVVSFSFLRSAVGNLPGRALITVDPVISFSFASAFRVLLLEWGSVRVPAPRYGRMSTLEPKFCCPEKPQCTVGHQLWCENKYIRIRIMYYFGCKPGTPRALRAMRGLRRSPCVLWPILSRHRFLGAPREDLAAGGLHVAKVVGDRN